MKQTRVTFRYAKALLSLAIDKKSEARVDVSMKLIIDTIAQNKDLDTIIKSPIIKASKKIAILNAVFKDTDDITKGLFHILEENKRLNILEDIAFKYTILYKDYLGVKHAEVTTVVALTKDLEDKIQAKIHSLIGTKVTIKNIIDESIIGGFILRVGDKQFDASIASKFANLQKSFDN